MKNTIIKVLSIVMAMVMALGTCIVVTGTAAAAECKHANYTQYGDPVAATCTTWGFTLYQCSDCGEHFKTEMNTLEKPHNLMDGFEWINVKTVKPTCVADGYTTKTCSICEKEEKYDFVSKSDKYHDWDDGVKTDSTCTDEGVMTYTCKICEKTKTTAISEKGHKWVALENQVVEPKCFAYVDLTNPADKKAAYGMMPYKCSACGATREVEIDPRTDHKYVLMDAVADSCEVIGHNAGYFCKWCLEPQNPLTDIINDSIKHVWTEVAGTEKKDATCDEDGFHTVYCANCKQTVVQTIVATGHDFDHENPTVHVDPTCTKWGYDLFGCTKCGVKYENVPYAPIGHKWAESGVKVDATCTTPGGIEYTCENGCGETKIEADANAPALGHGKLVEVEAVAATCGPDASTAKPGRTAGKKCEVCNQFVEGGIVIPALNCVKTTSICTVKGLKDVVCSRCGHIYEEGTTTTVLPDAVETHVYVKTSESIDPTCTTAGTDVLVCKYCGKGAVKSVPALGHDPETTVVEATCMAPGYKLVVCKRCGAQLSHEVLPVNPDGHVGEVVVNVDPTCESYGYQSGSCVYCGKPYEKTIAKLGHDIVTVEAKAPTCTEDGNTAGSSCKRCGTVFVESKKIDKLGHKEETLAGVEATCFTDGLTEGKKCKVCNVVTVAQTKIDKYDHYYNGVQYSEITVVTPTCKGAGRIGYVAHDCYYCDEAYIDQYSDVLEHFWGVKEHKDVNCVEDGYDYYECLNGCGAIKIDEDSRIKAEGHKDKNGNVISTSCTRPDDTDIVCVNAFCPCDKTCNADGEVQIVHEDKFAAHVVGTCEVYEHDIFVCTVCGRKTIQNVNDEFGAHKWKEVSKSADATYEKAQTIVEKCEVCATVQTRYVSRGISIKAVVDNASNPKENFVNGTKELKVTLSMIGDKAEFHNFFASFTYNKDHLVFVSADAAKTLGGATVSIDAYKVEDGKVNITTIVSNSSDGEVVNAVLTGSYETFVTLTFKIKGSVHSDSTGKTVDTSMNFAINGKVVNKDANAVGTAVKDAKNIVVNIYKLGDINNDGAVNNVDFLAISNIIKADGYLAVADLNGDDKVTEADLGLLQKIIIGRYKYADTAEARK